MQKEGQKRMKRISAKQLKIGTRHELEHTDDPETAAQIAMDHLREIPDYYTRLQKMEREFKREKRSRKG